MGGVEDRDEGVAGFVLLGGVFAEGGPGEGAGDEGFKTCEELAAVADAGGGLADFWCVDVGRRMVKGTIERVAEQRAQDQT